MENYVYSDADVRRMLEHMMNGFSTEIYHKPDLSHYEDVVAMSLLTEQGRRVLSVKVCIEVKETWPDGHPA